MIKMKTNIKIHTNRKKEHFQLAWTCTINTPDDALKKDIRQFAIESFLEDINANLPKHKQYQAWEVTVKFL